MRALIASAAYRMAFAASLAFALTMLAIGTVSYLAVEKALSAQLDQTIEQGSRAVLDEGTEGLPSLVNAIEQREQITGDKLDYALFDRGGQKIAGRLVTPMAHAGWSRIAFNDENGEVDAARAQTTKLPNGFRLTVAADLEAVESIGERLLEIFAIGFLAALAIGSGIAFAAGKYLKRRFTQIEDVALAFAGGDLRARAEVGKRDDEFDRLASALNTMLDRIAALVSKLKQVTSDLAHDMRTPLTRLRGDLEALDAAPAERREAMIAKALDRTDEILALFGAILRIAELEEGELQHRFKTVDVVALVADLVETHVPWAEDSGKVLQGAVCEACQVLGDRELIAQAMINLIENAVRHTPAGAEILVGARVQSETCHLFVADNGPGIPAAARGRVTERFVRLDTARSTPGNGLGLSLVKAIAEAHGGSLGLSARDPGFEAALILPRKLL